MVNNNSKFGERKMSEHEVGLLFTILGFTAGIIAIIITVAIYKKVDSIRKKQSDNAQGPYKANTEKNMNEIHGYFRDLIRITKYYDKDSEVPQDMTTEIESYYSTNDSKIKSLFEKSGRDLELWIDLDQGKRKQYQSIIDDFSWLINEFFQTNDDDEMQTRIWTDNHHELLQKKFRIEGILD